MPPEFLLQPGIPITSRSIRDISGIYDGLRGRARERVATTSRHQELSGTDFFPPFPTKINHFVNLAESIRKYVTPTSKALDMGSGGGKSMLYLASLGIPVVRGIELNPMEVAISNEIFSELEINSILEHENCKAYQGNFFPKGYNPPPVENPSLRAFSRSRLRSFQGAKWHNLDIEQIEQLDRQDPYQAMGMKLADFNIIYYYSYDMYDQELINLLSERCKPGTIIINAADWSTVDLPENIEVVEKVIKARGDSSGLTTNYGTIYRVKEKKIVEA